MIYHPVKGLHHCASSENMAIIEFLLQRDKLKKFAFRIRKTNVKKNGFDKMSDNELICTATASYLDLFRCWLHKVSKVKVRFNIFVTKKK